MAKWKCKVCGYIHEGEMTGDFKCPLCKVPASKFEKIEEAASAKNPFAGTKTEKNLWEAFAGESQARNKYTYFASVAKKAGYEQIALCSCRLPKMRRSTQSFGSRHLVSLAIPLRTFSTPQRARTTSGPICMTALLRTLRKRALPSLQHSSAQLPLSRRPMRSAIASCCTMWKQRPYLKRVVLPCGSAATAAIW